MCLVVLSLTLVAVVDVFLLIPSLSHARKFVSASWANTRTKHERNSALAGAITSLSLIDIDMLFVGRV